MNMTGQLYDFIKNENFEYVPFSETFPLLMFPAQKNILDIKTKNGDARFKITSILFYDLQHRMTSEPIAEIRVCKLEADGIVRNDLPYIIQVRSDERAQFLFNIFLDVPKKSVSIISMPVSMDFIEYDGKYYFFDEVSQNESQIVGSLSIPRSKETFLCNGLC